MASKVTGGDVVRAAEAMTRQAFPGSNQCAIFVRAVWKSLGVELGQASRPSDFSSLPPGEPLGQNYANSFAGDEVGRRVARAALEAGDVVMFENTMPSVYGPGIITHVGIYVGGSEMIHKGSSSQFPVRDSIASSYWAPKFFEARRPNALTGKAADSARDSVRHKAFAHSGKRTIYVGPNEKPTIDVHVTLTPDAQICRVNGRLMRLEKFELSAVDDFD